MLEWIIETDISLFLWLNGINSPFWDHIMFFVSKKESWIPIYLLLLIIIFRRSGTKETIFLLVSIGILITITDQTTSGFLKPWVGRFRPCQPEANLEFMVHIVNGKCGGKFGFASSHAANFFGLATFLGLWFANRRILQICLLIASVVAYSRIYLGVHYPLDVFVGALIGFFAGHLVFRLLELVKAKFLPNSNSMNKPEQ